MRFLSKLDEIPVKTALEILECIIAENYRRYFRMVQAGSNAADREIIERRKKISKTQEKTEKGTYKKPRVTVVDLTAEIELAALARCSGNWSSASSCS